MIKRGDLIFLNGGKNTINNTPRYNIDDKSSAVLRGFFGWKTFAIVLTDADDCDMVCIIESTGLIGKTYCSKFRVLEQIVPNS